METEHVGKLSIVEGDEHDDLCTTLVLHGEDHTLGNNIPNILEKVWSLSYQLINLYT